MAEINVAVMVGSIRKDSLNLQVARAIEKLMPANLKFHYVRIDDLPLYTQEFDDNYPEVCQRLKQTIESADALLFVTPEYNRSVPGVLKNAIDIASRPWGTNSFAGKSGGILGTSIGAQGAAMAQQHLRNILVYLDIQLLTQPEMYMQYREGTISPDGTINNSDTQKYLQNFVDKYVAWLQRLGV